MTVPEPVKIGQTPFARIYTSKQNIRVQPDESDEMRMDGQYGASQSLDKSMRRNHAVSRSGGAVGFRAEVLLVHGIGAPSHPNADRRSLRHISREPAARVENPQAIFRRLFEPGNVGRELAQEQVR